ncbi:MAG: diacylglycerol kinase family lipid kinase [Thermoanaerobaculia bacterium]|nr:diacylglycerol kinase family lipid kinase [Thermoanaerobaculia bacterium]
MKRGLLIYNPTAGQRNRSAQMLGLIERMRGEGIELVNSPTSRPLHATEMVKAGLLDGLDLVAVCGGDGTVSEAATGLVGSTIPLVVLPAGTSNVLARELSIPLSVSAAARLMVDGEERPVRVLLANDRPFLLWAGIGLDARIMGHMSTFLKRWLGRTGIFFTVAPEFFRYEFPKLQVTADGETHEATFAVVCHARRYAGEWVIAPYASLDSEEMDVLLFSDRNRWKFLSLFRQLQLGKSGHLERGIARTVRAREVQVRSLENYPIEVQVDGDCVLETPIACRTSDQTVRIMVPRGSQHPN